MGSLKKVRPTEAEFLGLVAEHRMTIVHDEGVHRHVRFARPDSGFDAFSLTTWPGHLAITGDWDDYVFARTYDMFGFFRRGRAGDPLELDRGYWSKKVVAISRCGPLEEFDEEKFRRAVWEEARHFPKEARDRVAEEVVPAAEYGLEGAVRAACEFQAGGRHFDSFYENDLTVPSRAFVQACFAILWGIRLYDEAKAVEAARKERGVTGWLRRTWGKRPGAARRAAG